MRVLLVIALLAASIALAHAQEQERKLLDRVLKPDMSLQNDMQSKQFSPGGTVETKRATTKWFFLRKRTPEKEFAGAHDYGVKTFATQQSRFTSTQANLSTRSQLPKMHDPYPAPGYTGVKRSADADRVVQTDQFVNAQRPFLVEGKSQKFLSAKDTPMTIDQVRDLLNKNK